MTCEVCNRREAVIHVQEQSPGGVRTVRLCLECAAVKGLNIRNEDVQSLFTNFIANLFDNDPSKPVNPPSLKLLNLKCPTCGMELSKIIEDKKAGCQFCFHEFPQFINTVIYAYNNSVEYKGSLPPEIEHYRKYKMTILKLKKDLRLSVKQADFSKAIILRDKIKTIRREYRKGKNIHE